MLSAVLSPVCIVTLLCSTPAHTEQHWQYIIPTFFYCSIILLWVPQLFANYGSLQFGVEQVVHNRSENQNKKLKETGIKLQNQSCIWQPRLLFKNSPVSRLVTFAIHCRHCLFCAFFVLFLRSHLVRKNLGRLPKFITTSVTA